MKRCPQCYEVYENSEKFCELDGEMLLADPALAADYEGNISHNTELKRGPWVSGLVGLSIGIFLCTGVYVTYSLWTTQSGSDVYEAPVYASRKPDTARPIRPAPEPIPELNQDAEPTPSREEEATGGAFPPTPVHSGQTVGARLNQGPVSTGQSSLKEDGGDGGAGRTIIQMRDGNSVEADAAWEDKQGVWYRRGGLVSFVAGERVESITSRPDPKLTTTPPQPVTLVS